MSREMFVTLDEADVIRRCNAEKVGISATEPLPKGGTRLVCMSVDGAAHMYRKLKTHLIAGAVDRQRLRPSRLLW